MAYTMEDFKRDFIKEHFKELSSQERRELFLRSLPPEEREQIRHYLDQLTAGRSTAAPRKPRRKK